jgi:hypothetical protein
VAAVEEEVSTVVALEVEVSTGEALEEEVSAGEGSAVASTAAALVVAHWLPDMSAAESAAVAAESALADRTSQVAFRTLPGQDPGSPPLVIHPPDSLYMMDDLIEPQLPTSSALVARWLQSLAHRKHFRNAE